jgi:hypothetical protein
VFITTHPRSRQPPSTTPEFARDCGAQRDTIKLKTAKALGASIAAPYWRPRASLSISVTVTLYFAITLLTKAVTSPTSGLSGISAFSMSIMPFSMAT